MTTTDSSDAIASSRKVGPSVPGPRHRFARPVHLKVGDRVMHDRYGAGVVVKTDGEGSHARASVNFEEHGTKQLVLAMTPLRRA